MEESDFIPSSGTALVAVQKFHLDFKGVEFLQAAAHIELNDVMNPVWTD